MIELFTADTPNGKKITIMLEEIGCDFKVTKIDIFKDEQFKADFKKISPFGKIPVITDHENKLSLFESGAILIYLGEKYNKELSTFGFGKKDFTPNSKESLKFIAGVLKADPSVTIEVNGHSDSQEEGLGASKEEFSDMGMVRANYVKRYFLANGIDESRITVKSHRDTEISREIAPSVDDEELKAAKSRRVEFKLN